MKTIWLSVLLLLAAACLSGAEGLASEDELFEGPEYSNAFKNPKDNPSLPNVLLIGDSISIGYTVDVRKQLAGKADVFRIPGNGKNSAYGLKNLNKWLGKRKWDVIHFNWGLWDLCYRHPESKTQGHRDKVNGTITATPEQYRANMEKVVARLKKTDATLVWCTTTPVPEDEAGRKLGDDIIYNQIAAEIMNANGILINDLHAHALLKHAEIQKQKGDVHYTKEGYAYLAEKVVSVISPALASPARPPNILWIFIEDMNPLLSCYGDPLLKTPHFDRLAENGVLFEQCFVPAPVCSPCRSGLMAGMMPTTFGAHNHRVYDKSEVQLPAGVKTLPELFRDAGYYTFNAGKTDYNFMSDRKLMYDQQCSNKIKLPGNGIKKQDWKGYPEDKPFFGQLQREGGKQVFYYGKLYNRGGWGSRAFKMDPQVAAETLPTCYPKDPVLLKNWAEHYDCVAAQDWDVGCILKDLENKNLLENTIVFAFSDHGLFLPRHKQFCYDGGLQVPLIVSYFGADPEIKKTIEARTRRNDLVSLLDVSATSLALAGLEIPDWHESKDLFSPDYKRDYIVATRDRDDFTIDRIRAIRTADFKYIRNFMTDRPYMQPQYRDTKDFVIRMKELYAEGKLTSGQAWFWADGRPAEELYDLRKDPGELHNIASDPAYKDQLEQMRGYLDEWIRETGDKGQFPESETQLLAVVKNALKHPTWHLVNPEYEPVFKKYADEIDAVKRGLAKKKKKAAVAK